MNNEFYRIRQLARCESILDSNLTCSMATTIKKDGILVSITVFKPFGGPLYLNMARTFKWDEWRTNLRHPVLMWMREHFAQAGQTVPNKWVDALKFDPEMMDG